MFARIFARKQEPPKGVWSQIFKRNPYHDAHGRFTSKDKAGHAAADFATEPHDKAGNVNLSEHYKKFDDPQADVRVLAAKVLKQFPPRQRALLKAAEVRAKGLKTSEEEYMRGGKYTAERQKLHARIIEKFLSPADLERATPAKGEKPTFVVLGGRGGSGKGAFTNGKLKEFDSSKFIVIDPDEIKKELVPPYAGWNAFSVHDESSHLTDMMIASARGWGVNVVLDATMRSLHVADEMKRMKKKGYRIEGHYMFLPRQQAAKRAVERFLGPDGKGKGRMVPPEVVLGNTSNEANFELLKKQFDRWSAYDNQGSEPKLLGRGGRT